jgi:hypothetical protein
MVNGYILLASGLKGSRDDGALSEEYWRSLSFDSGHLGERASAEMRTSLSTSADTPHPAAGRVFARAADCIVLSNCRKEKTPNREEKSSRAWLRSAQRQCKKAAEESMKE